MKKIFIYLIEKYQKYISPILGNHCKYTKTGNKKADRPSANCKQNNTDSYPSVHFQPSFHVIGA